MHSTARTLAPGILTIAAAAAVALAGARFTGVTPSRPGAVGSGEAGSGAPEGLPSGKLTLETVACPDDASPSPGFQVAIELWMRDLTSNASGFQAFLVYDTGTLSYRGDLSAYTALPFPMHVQDLATAEVVPGQIRVDGSDDFLGGGTNQDSLLVTLVFDVDVECTTTSVNFDLNQLFDSELSFEGVPIPTTLVDTGSFYLDDTPPDLGPCPNVTMPADTTGTGCDGAIVDYSDPPASDNCLGPVTVDCSPPSGSFFPVGMTTVTCTATDGCGNESMCMFTVTVTATNTFDVEVELVGSEPATRCIHFVTDSCGNTADYELDFTDHDSNPVTPVRAIATIEMGCGNWTQLCAKDQQHTKWDTTTLTDTGTGYVADTLLSLVPGDDDDDGDVDINDITILLIQFGQPEPFGDCEWNGVRGTDFSNDGNVGSEDYSLLTMSWLTVSGCACTLAQEEPFAAALPRTSVSTADLAPEIGVKADLDASGVVDWRDVEIFERRNGLPLLLSTQIRAADPSARLSR